MRKAWRNPRQVIVNEALPERDDDQRVEGLVCLVALGLERLLAQQSENAPGMVDFQPVVLPNTCTENKTPNREKY